jgi:hypothetical protein
MRAEDKGVLAQRVFSSGGAPTFAPKVRSTSDRQLTQVGYGSAVAEMSMCLVGRLSNIWRFLVTRDNRTAKTPRKRVSRTLQRAQGRKTPSRQEKSRWAYKEGSLQGIALGSWLLSGCQRASCGRGSNGLAGRNACSTLAAHTGYGAMFVYLAVLRLTQHRRALWPAYASTVRRAHDRASSAQAATRL